MSYLRILGMGLFSQAPHSSHSLRTLNPRSQLWSLSCRRISLTCRERRC